MLGDIMLLIKAKRWPFAGALFGVASALRPTLIIAAPLLFAAGARRAALVCVGSAFITVGTTCALWGTEMWFDYFHNPQYWEKSFLKRGLFEKVLGPVTAKASLVFQGISFETGVLPSFTTNLTFIGLANQGLFPSEYASLTGKIFVLVTFFAGMGAAYFLNRGGYHLKISLLPVLLTLAIIDFGIPVRFSYNYLLFVPLCWLLAPIAANGDRPAIIALLGFSLLSFPIVVFTEISILRPLFLVGTASVCTTFYLFRQRQPVTHSAG